LECWKAGIILAHRRFSFWSWLNSELPFYRLHRDSTSCQPKLFFQYIIPMMRLTVPQVHSHTLQPPRGRRRSAFGSSKCGLCSHLHNEDLYAQAFFLPGMAVCICQGSGWKTESTLVVLKHKCILIDRKSCCLVLKRLKEQVFKNNSRHLSLDPPWKLLPLPQAEGREVGATICTDLFGFKETRPQLLARGEGPTLRTVRPLPRRRPCLPPPPPAAAETGL